jgi:transposase
MSLRRYEITDFEWSIIAPLLPNKPRGVPRADDRKVLNGIFWRLRTGSPWADIPERYGPCTTCYNRFVRWRKLGVWDRLTWGVSRQVVSMASLRCSSMADPRLGPVFIMRPITASTHIRSGLLPVTMFPHSRGQAQEGWDPSL